MNEVSKLFTTTEVAEIRQLHKEICDLAGTALSKAIELGGKLEDARSRLKHGQWLPFVKHVGISDQTARNYIRLWDHRDFLKSKNVLNLTDAYAATLPTNNIDKINRLHREIVTEGKKIPEAILKMGALMETMTGKDKILMAEAITAAMGVEIGNNIWECAEALTKLPKDMREEVLQRGIQLAEEEVGGPFLIDYDYKVFAKWFLQLVHEAAS